jgi:hypothetical protein
MNLSMALLLAGAAGMGVPAAGGEDLVALLPPPMPADQGLRWASRSGPSRSAPSADPAAKRRRKAQRAARREQRGRR